MERFILKRIAQMAVTLFIFSFLIFMLSRVTGDPAALIIPPDAPPEAIEQLRHHFGLDKPLLVQYGLFLQNAVRGDLGISFVYRTSVTEVIAERIPATLKLAAAAIAISLVLAIPLAVLAAAKRRSPLDALSIVVGVLGQSVPSFWLGIMLIVIFGAWLKVLPVAGTGGIEYYILPAFTLGWVGVAGILRLLRSSMIDVLDSEFVKLVRLKGLPEGVVLWKHCLKNAITPVMSFAGVFLATLVTGAIMVEIVFAWPGIGRLVYNALMNRDFPVFQGVMLLTAAWVMFVNLIVDILYAYIDPRIRY